MDCKGFWEELSLLRDRDDALITLEFCRERFGACPRDLIIDAPLVVHFRVEAFIAFFHETSIEHPLERTVERARLHGYFFLRVCFDLFHDAIAVPLSARERQEDMEYSWCERWSVSGSRHNSRYIRDGYSCQELISCRVVALLDTGKMRFSCFCREGRLDSASIAKVTDETFASLSLKNFDQQIIIIAGRNFVEMAGIEPASERFDPRKSTSVACRILSSQGPRQAVFPGTIC